MLLEPCVAEQLQVAAPEAKLPSNAKAEAFSILSGAIKSLYPSMPSKFCSQRTRLKEIKALINAGGAGSSPQFPAQHSSWII